MVEFEGAAVFGDGAHYVFVKASISPRFDFHRYLDISVCQAGQVLQHFVHDEVQLAMDPLWVQVYAAVETGIKFRRLGR